MMETAKKVKRLLTVEENTLAGGFGSAVLQSLQSLSLRDVQARCLGIPDEFVEHAPQSVLRAKYSLDASGIAGRIVDSFPELRQPLLHNGRRGG
jgi:1-deoxy-D-xylulose-5-phosphate synthase